MQTTAAVIVISLALMWMVQYGLTFRQMRRYYRRLRELRQKGNVWVGLCGSAWKGRQYAVIVVDENERIVTVEQLSGWTVLAELKPVAGFEGRPVSDVTDDSIDLHVSKKLLFALRDAVEHMKAYASKKAEENLKTEQARVANCSYTQG